jgi:predicted metal-binding membrane protein
VEIAGRLERGQVSRDVWITGMALAAVAAVAWIALLRGAASGMTAPAFLAGWLVMMAAMMLPSAAPLVLVYRRGASTTATTALTVGYLVLWALTGVAAYAAHMTVEGSRAAAAVLVGAGLYELTPLKARFLRVCRDVAGFLITRWRATTGGAFRLGVEHGMYCLGCCWALMAVLVVAAAMGLAWAAVIALAVFAEKVLPGERLWRVAIAATLITLGVATLVV